MAQPRIPRVGFLFSFVPSEGEHLWSACRQGLRELGYVENQTIRLEPRWADGSHARLPGLVAELVRLKVDVIVAAATPASLAAKSGAGTTPIVFVAVADPIRAGLVASLARPGGNVTGLTLLTPELSGRRLQLLVEILGPVARVAILINPDNASHLVFADETLGAARQMQIQVHSLYARNNAEIDRAFQEALRVGAQGMIVFDDPVTWSLRKQVAGTAARLAVPAMYGYSEFVEEGGLISYGPYRPDLYRRTAAYVDKLLKGAQAAQLPIERPTRFELFENLNNARALRLNIPPSTLTQAERVTE
jgi:putative ABC transport system substrate-binding protein